MLRGVPWSKRMSIGERRRGRTRGCRLQTGCRKMQDGINLLSRYREFLHYFFDGQASFQILEYGRDRHSGILEDPCAANLTRDALHGGAL